MAFKKGQSGNPGGRPLFGKKIRDMLAVDMDLYVETLKRAALSGDVQALKMIFDRLMPVPKSTRDTVIVPGLHSAENLTERANVVLDNVARGVIGTEDATALLSGIAGVIRTTELDEVMRRLALLEAPTTKRSSDE